MSIESLHYEYLKKKIQCIPVNGKHPSIDGWNEIVVTEDLIDYWFSGGNIRHYTGLAMLVGERSDGICCLDMDTDDPETIDRVNKFLDIPYLVSKRGAKGFGAFFRLKEPLKPGQRPIMSFKINGKAVCEVFLGNKYVVLPPSEHPDGGHYKWISSQTFFDIDTDDLPEISYEKLERLGTVISAPSFLSAQKLLPKEIDSGGPGRWSSITTMAGSLLNQGADDTAIMQNILSLDRTTFAHDQFFLSKEKLGKSYQGDNDTANCYNWLADFKRNIFTKNPDLVAQLANKFETRVDYVHTTAGWAHPVLFGERELSRTATEMPIEIFPKIYQEYCLDHAERMAVNPDGIMGTMLIGLGSLLQGRILIYPKGKPDGFCVRPNLYGMTVGPSGVKKDSIMGCGLHFFEEIILAVQNRPKDELKAQERLEQRLYVQHKKRKKAFAEEDDIALVEAEDKCQELQKELAEINMSRPTLRFQSGTTEKLIEIMHKNQERCILIHQSEFKGLMAQMEKKGNEPLRPLFLKAANGTDREGYSHMTMAGLNVEIKKLSACMLTGVQDDVLNSSLSGVKKGTVDNDGFLQRFLYFFVKSSNKRMVSRNTEPDYNEIQNKFWCAYNLDQNYEIEFTLDARELFLDHEYTVQQNRANRTTDSALESLQSKYIGLLPKIAFLIEFMGSSAGKMPQVVTFESVKKAIEFIEWQRVSVEAFWYNSDTSALYRTALRVIEDAKMKVIESGIPISKMKRYYREIDVTVLKRVLKVLEDRNWVRVDSTAKEYIVYFHPDIL